MKPKVILAGACILLILGTLFLAIRGGLRSRAQDPEAQILGQAKSSDSKHDSPPVERPKTTHDIPEQMPSPGVFQQPRGIGVAPDGSVFVADFRHFRIQHLSSSLQPLGIIANTWQGNAEGQLNDPCDVAIAEDGTLYVADTMNGRIQKFGQQGQFMGMWSGLFAPRGLALSRDGRRLYVAETGYSRIIVYSPEGEELNRWGGEGEALGELSQPVGIRVDSKGNIWVAERGNARLQVFDENGQSHYILEIQPWQEDCPNAEPYFDLTPEDDIVLSAPSLNQILKYSKDGRLLAKAKEAGGVPFARPSGVACLSDGNVVVSDTWNHRVVLVGPKDFLPE